MTYLSAQPYLTSSWDDICYPVSPVWLADILPDYDIMATDRQQLIVGQAPGGKRTVFGIQSADYAIIPNVLIREIVDKVFDKYNLQIKYTTTGEFSISIILPQQLSIGGERLQRSLILTNSYNGKTPFSIQGQTMTTMLDNHSRPGSTMYRAVCENGLMGWADCFIELSHYQHWLKESSKEKTKSVKRGHELKNHTKKDMVVRKIHHSRSSLTLNDRYKLDEKVFHQLSANTFA